MTAAPPTLTIEYLLLPELATKFLQKNPKLHDIGAISTSICRYGFRDPLAIDATLNGGEGGIAEGNGRLEALLCLHEQGEKPPAYIKLTESGDWVVPCVVGGDSDTEAEGLAYSIDHNSLTLAGGTFTPLDISRLYNPTEYTEVLEKLAQAQALPVAVDGDDLGLLLKQIAESSDSPQEEDKKSLVTDLNKAASNKIESRVTPGQIWQLGRHRLACADSTNENNVRAFLGSKLNHVGMVWADAPYGIDIVGKDGSLGSGTKGKYQPIIGDDTTEVAYNSFRLCTRLFSCPQVFWGANHFAGVVTDSSCWIVWDKQDGKSVSFADCELAWTNIPEPARIFKHVWDGFRRDSEVGVERVHPTQKPVALPEWVFGKYGKQNDLIFDPFLGSAPSIIAAQQMPGSRVIYGMELSPQYCEVILRRYESLTGETAELIGSL